MLAPVDKSDPEALDAHPLVREWFGERLRQTNEAAWKAAHSRLYDHLRRTTHEGSAPTLADLVPLYHAIAHGCRAGRHEKALEEVYVDRICRRLPDGGIEFYATKTLGAAASNLAAIFWFFDAPFARPVTALPAPDRSWVLGEAGAGLRAQARLQEALPVIQAGLRAEEKDRLWANAAIDASNLSEIELLIGEIDASLKTAERSVRLADRGGGAFEVIQNRTTRAAALLARGHRKKSERLFADAQRRQNEWQPLFPLLYSRPGYWYCDFLLSQGNAAIARNHAATTLQWARARKVALDVALDTLTLGRADLALAHLRAASRKPRETIVGDASAGGGRIDDGIDGLRASGQFDHFPRGLLARAAFRRTIGDWDGAARDLDEVEEIAEPGPMRLYLCDCALERARLALARREAFAPLNGLVEPSPPPPALPDASEAAHLLEEARNELDVARKLIAECGYHRRDEELAELDDVAAGLRRFADLPPRV